MQSISVIISDLENIAEILFNNGYNSWGNTIRKAVGVLNEQKDDEYICSKCSRGLKRNWKWCPYCGQKTESLFVWIKDPVRFVEGD